MTYNNFKPNPKTLDKIQKYMHDNKSKFKERGKMSANTMFVFPDGEVIHIDSHKESTYIIRKNLRLKCIKGLLDIQQYGIIRIGFMADIFYVHSIEPPTKQAEESIIDMIVLTGTNNIMIQLHPDYKKTRDSLGKTIL